MRYWWVNQNQTYRAEVAGGFLWSPKRKSNGGRNQFYDNMQTVREGDVIFSFSDTFIPAVGIAVGQAETAPKPDYGKSGINWSNEGWLVPAEFKPLPDKFRPKDHIDILRPFLPDKYSPLQDNGDGMQAVYLAEVPELMAKALGALIGGPYDDAVAFLRRETVTLRAANLPLDEELEQRTDIGPTTKLQLVNARRGQGLFKANVRLIENNCRLTAIKEPAHLIASHIKPWRDCSDHEKLDGHNGLLLSPHVDHLFDQGFITFVGDGDLKISGQLEGTIMQSWGLPLEKRCGTFTSRQREYLEYHNAHVFRS